MNAIEMELQMSTQLLNTDPALEDAESVMVSLLYVATLYIKKPTLDLAKMALRLSETLNLPQYTESALICSVARRMCVHWTLQVIALEQAAHHG